MIKHFISNIIAHSGVYIFIGIILIVLWFFISGGLSSLGFNLIWDSASTDAKLIFIGLIVLTFLG